MEQMIMYGFLPGYEEYFALTYTTDKWILSITQSLDDSVLSENVELIIVLSATETGNTNEGYSVLILELPSDTDAITFEKTYYIAEYPKDGTGNIELVDPINLQNVDDVTKVTITLDSK